ncbi:MAG: phosphotransferase-like protein [Acidimicrobiales bacterium]
MVVVILNGAPRSGKSSIASAMQALDDRPWMNLGVDSVMAATPPHLQPGIGLRPGGERPDLEPFVARSYRALFEAIAGHDRNGLSVVADLGIHDWYSASLGIWAIAAELLTTGPSYVIGVRCSVDEIVVRRAASASGPVRYETTIGDVASSPVLRWQEAVHRPGLYDHEVHTDELDPAHCARRILHHMTTAPPTALGRIRAAVPAAEA